MPRFEYVRYVWMSRHGYDPDDNFVIWDDIWDRFEKNFVFDSQEGYRRHKLRIRDSMASLNDGHYYYEKSIHDYLKDEAI